MKKLKNQEITSLAKTVCRMIACTSHNRAKKFGEKEVCWTSFWKSNNEMVKRAFHPYLFTFLLFLIDFLYYFYYFV
jgi:aminoglycoside phosphotransferase family enzyme